MSASATTRTSGLPIASAIDLEKAPVAAVLASLGANAETGLKADEVTRQPQLQTAVFLQLATGGHLVLFVARSARWFFLRPFPAIRLGAIFATQLLAIVFAYFGWLVPAVPIQTIVWVLVYDVVWLFIVGAGRIAAEMSSTAGQLTARRASRWSPSGFR